MSYNILGINPFHNGSACVLSDGEIVYFLEEERLSRRKHDPNPFRVILDILNRFKIDEIVIGGINDDKRFLCYTEEDPFEALIHKYYPNIPATNVSNHHHTLHSLQSFSNSGFSNSLGIVVDGGGSLYPEKGRENSSIYFHSIEKGHKCLLKVYSPNPTLDPNIKYELGIAKSYSGVSTHLGFNMNEEGKTMGLSSYGKSNELIPKLFKKDFSSNPDFIYGRLEATSPVNSQNDFLFKHYITLTPPRSPLDKSDFSQNEKDLAWKIQNDSQKQVGDLIEKGIKETGLTQVCCAGGYFLNCVSNYYLTKRFPNIEFYFEPISHDGGTSIGAAKLIWNQKTKDTTIRPQKTLYHGPKYSKEELLEGIKKYI